LLVRIALDATYSVGENLSGVGVYSREVIAALAAAHPETDFLLCYRPHRFLRSFSERLPRNCRRLLLHEPLGPRSAAVWTYEGGRLVPHQLRLGLSDANLTEVTGGLEPGAHVVLRTREVTP
jgi:hypothetical protein